jgi:hypothetical protein
MARAAAVCTAVTPSALPVVGRLGAVFARLRSNGRSGAPRIVRMLGFVTGAAHVAGRIVTAVTRLGERHASTYTAGNGKHCCNENLRDR